MLAGRPKRRQGQPCLYGEAIVPSVVVTAYATPVEVTTCTLESASAVWPGSSTENWSVESTPEPLGPACAPTVLHPKVTVPSTASDGGGQVTDRPVEPSSVPFVTPESCSRSGSQLSVNW